VFRAGEANNPNATPVGDYYSFGAIFPELQGTPPIDHQASEVWSISGVGTITTHGLHPVVGETQLAINGATGAYRFANLDGQYRHQRIDPDGRVFNGDEFTRGIFIRFR
jgi:hypothetical protein